MADIQRARGASRPVSAVEKSRAAREGGNGVTRPASAGVWRGKPSVYVSNMAKVLGSGSDASVSVGSASESGGQHGGGRRGNDDDRGKPAPSNHSRSSSIASSTHSKPRKGGADVWVVGPLPAATGRKGEAQSGSRPNASATDVPLDGDGTVRQQRLFKLGRLGSEADRLALQQMENALMAAAARGGSTTGDAQCIPS